MITTSRQSSARAMRQQALVCELHTTAHRLDQLLLMPIFGEGNDFAEGQKEEEMDNTAHELNAQMQSKLIDAGLPFESLKVFGVIRRNVHVVCVSRDSAQKWASLLAQVFGTQPSMTRYAWDAKHNQGTCLRPSKRKGWLVGVIS